MGNLETENESPQLEMDNLGSNAITIEDDGSKSRSSGSPASSSSSSLGRKKWIVNGNGSSANKVAPIDHFQGVYKGKLDFLIDESTFFSLKRGKNATYKYFIR